MLLLNIVLLSCQQYIMHHVDAALQWAGLVAVNLEWLISKYSIMQSLRWVCCRCYSSRAGQRYSPSYCLDLVRSACTAVFAITHA